MRINPVLKKELNLNSKNIKLSLLIFVVNVVLLCVAAFLLFRSYNDSLYYGYFDYSITSKLYIILSYIEFLMLILIVPITSSGAISIEKERQTLDVLLSTQLKPYEIISGKIQATLFIAMILIVSTMPIVGLTFMFGGIEIVDVCVLIGVLMLEAILFSIIGIFFSTIFKKTTLATIATYVTLIIMTVGSYVIVRIVYYMLQQQNISIEVSTDIKGVIYILLINPAITFSGLISMQVGNRREILDICSRFGEYGDSYLVNHWITISIAIQMIIATILFLLATRNIDPQS